MGPTWVLPAPDGPHVGPMKLAIRAPSLPSPDLFMIIKHVSSRSDNDLIPCLRMQQVNYILRIYFGLDQTVPPYINVTGFSLLCHFLVWIMTERKWITPESGYVFWALHYCIVGRWCNWYQNNSNNTRTILVENSKFQMYNRHIGLRFNRYPA